MENKISKYQKFTVKKINRREIKNAPYNPRKISDYAVKKLKANIKKVGLIETLVVNQNTMNLVSGHQRLKVLDQLEKTDDYFLEVAMVDMTDEEERSQNVFMNNITVQGEYDLDLLKDMFDAGLEWDATGFDDADKAFYFGNTLEAEPSEPAQREIENFKKLKEINNIRNDINVKSDADTYIVLHFPSTADKWTFINKYNLDMPGIDYIHMDGNTVANLIIKDRIAKGYAK